MRDLLAHSSMQERHRGSVPPPVMRKMPTWEKQSYHHPTCHYKEMVVEIDWLQGSVPFLTSNFTFVISLRAMLSLGWGEGGKI